MAIYAEVEDLVNVGAYNKGSNKDIDEAIDKIGAINAFLTQKTDDNIPLNETIDIMKKIIS